MGKYYLGTGNNNQINFQVVDSTGVINDLNLSGLYLSATGKAVDADKLDNYDSSYFRNASNLTGVYTGQISGGGVGNADTLDGYDSSYFLNASNITGTIASGRMPAFSGDVTTSAGSTATTIASNVVSLAKMAQVATSTILGRATAATGNVEALTAAQAKTVLAIAQADVSGLTTASSPTFAGLTVASGNSYFAYVNSSSYFQAAGSSGNAWAWGSTGGTAAPSTLSTSLGLHNWNGSAWSNPFVVTSAGNVGVGTTSPSVKLSISQNGSVNNQYIQLVDSQAGGSTWQIANNAANVIGEFGIYDASNGAYRMVINSSGNVGIGTTSPAAKLHTVNTVDVEGPLFENTGGRGSITVKASSTNSAYINFGNANGNSRAFIDFRESTGYLSLATSFSGGHIIFSTDAQVEKMRITSAGNVGIGTTAPVATLHVNKNDSGTTEINPVVIVQNAINSTNTTAGIMFAMSSDSNYQKQGIFAKYTNGSYSIGELHFAVNGAFNSTKVSVADSKMRIAASGDVSISSNTAGTASAGALVVTGGISAGPSYFGGSVKLNGGGDLAGNTLYLNLGGSASYVLNAYTGLIMYNSAAVNTTGGILNIQSGGLATNFGGNVGIGQASPSYKLEVETGVGDADGIRVRDSAVGVWTDIRRRYIECTGADFWINSQSSSLDLRTANSSKLFITLSGNVGIGTTVPNQKFEVTGGAIIASGFGNRAAGTGKALEIGMDGTQGVLQAYDRSSSTYIPLAISASTTTFSGAVTVSGTGTFSGNGIVLNGATKVIYFGNPSADYLFFDGSNLITRLGSVDRLTINGTTGAATFAGAVAGAGGLSLTNGGQISQTGGGTSQVFNTITTTAGTMYIGVDSAASAVFGGPAYTGYVMAPSGKSLILGSVGNGAITIASTGTATFASTVTATGAIVSNFNGDGLGGLNSFRATVSSGQTAGLTLGQSGVTNWNFLNTATTGTLAISTGGGVGLTITTGGTVSINTGNLIVSGTGTSSYGGTGAINTFGSTSNLSSIDGGIGSTAAFTSSGVYYAAAFLQGSSNRGITGRTNNFNTGTSTGGNWGIDATATGASFSAGTNGTASGGTIAFTAPTTVSLLSTSVSSSAVTGALQVAGGIGVGAASYFAGWVTAAGGLTVTGNSFLNTQAFNGASPRNFGPKVWTDNLFGMELGNNGTLWTTRILTRDSDGGIELGKYPSGSATNVNQFTPWMTLINNGNVGIGTTSPSGFSGAKVLDVFQSTSDHAQIIVEGNNGSNFVQITSGTGSGSSGGSIITNNDLRFAIATSKDVTGYSEKMRIASATGNVSIASTTASSSAVTGALQVAGGIGVAGASYFGGTETYFQGSTGNTNLISTRAGTSNGATFQYKTGAYLKWYHGLRGLVNDNFYIHNQSTDVSVLVLDVATNAATFVGAVTIGGDLIVNGTTTTVNSTTVTVDDPIITLGGDTTPTVDDNKDRGIEFKWHNGTIAKAGFFGFDDSTGYLTFIPDATNTSEVFSGTVGDIQATNFRGNLIGNVTGNVSGSAGSVATLTAGGYLTGTSFNGSAAVTFAVDATSANTVSKVVARDASGNFSAGTITGTRLEARNSGTTQVYLDSTTSGSKEIVFQNNGVVAGYVWASGGYVGVGGGGATTSLFVTTASGNVGVGTAAPGAKLEVASTNNTETVRMSLSTDSGFRNSFYNYFDGASPDLNWMALKVASAANTQTEVMRLLGDGKVGIGTASPTAKLTTYYTGIYDSGTTRFVDITGDFAGTSAATTPNAGAFTGIRMGNITNGKYAMIGAVSEDALGYSRANGLSFWTSPQDTAPIERVRISNSGNVGIGWTTPYSTLTVGSNDSTAVITPGGNNTHLTLKTVGASGAIRFYATGGTTSNVATTESMRVDAGGNVGIGTTSPSYKLTINSLAGTNAQLALTIGDILKTAFTSVSSDGSLRIYHGGSDSVVIGSSGNVGIGTTSPSYKFQVESALATNATFTTNSNMLAMFKNTTSAASAWGGIKLQADEGSGIWFSDEYGTNMHGYISTRYTGQMDFATGQDSATAATVKMSILTNGNVGIGTTSPGAKFEIKDGDIWLNGATGASNPEIRFIDDSGIASAGAKIRYGNNDGNLYIEHIWDNAASGIFFKNRTAGTSLNTLSLVNGNVGIGTTSPSCKLDFGTAVANSARILGIYTTGNLFTGIGMGATTAGIRLAGDSGGNNLVDIGYYSLDGAYTWTSKMFINGSGNVGIGTTSPGTKLDVLSGTANTAGDSVTSSVAKITGPNVAIGVVGNNGGLLNIDTNDALGADIGGSIGFGGRYTGTAQAQWALIKAGKTNSTDSDYSGYLAFGTRNNGSVVAERMRIDNLGNVGIGTMSPSYKLDVAGGVKIGGEETLPSAIGSMYLSYNSAINRIYYGDGTGYDLRFSKRGASATTDFVTFKDTGYVGIGTTAPSAKLTINTSFATTNALTVSSDGTSHSQLILRKAASKAAYSVMAWENQVFIGAGIYYENAAWVHHNINANNNMFVLNPGTGVTWYASNNSSGSWNVSSDITLWNDSGIWTSLVQSTRTGNSYFTGGNVGIGTTSPSSSKLQVHTSATGQTARFTDDTNSTLIVDHPATGRVRFNTGGSAQGYQFDMQGVTNVLTIVGTSGNIGIGTSSPVAKLDVTGNVKVGGGTYSPIPTNALHVQYGNYNDTTNTAQINLVGGVGDNGNVTGFTLGSIKTNGVGTGARFTLNELVWSGTAFTQGNTALTVLSGGNVGIGTTSPNDGLEVYNKHIRISNTYNAGSVLKIYTNDNAVADGSIQWYGSDNLLDAMITANGAASGDLQFYTGAGGATAKLTIQSGGNVGIGTITPGYKLEVNGSFAATTKSFVIKHPTKEGKKLRYGSLEGPENGIYIRGKTTSKVIELPDYWTKLVDPDSISVQLTSIGSHQKLYVEKIENNKVYISNENLLAKSINCFFYILAERADVEKLQVEIDG